MRKPTTISPWPFISKERRQSRAPSSSELSRFRRNLETRLALSCVCSESFDSSDGGARNRSCLELIRQLLPAGRAVGAAGYCCPDLRICAAGCFLFHSIPPAISGVDDGSSFPSLVARIFHMDGKRLHPRDRLSQAPNRGTRILDRLRLVSAVHFTLLRTESLVATG